MPNVESQENLFSISARSEGRLPEIRKQLLGRRHVAFLVTADFKIHVGSTGLHRELYAANHINPEDQDAVIYKGQISGSAKKIYFERMNDGQSEASENEGQALIKEKINELLDLPDYYQ